MHELYKLKYNNYSTEHVVLEFTERNVRNAIASIKNIRELGERLSIPSSQLDDIDKVPLEYQKQKFVEEWFKVGTECNWKSLQAAFSEIKVLEWATSKSGSGSSMDEQLLNPKSYGSRGGSFNSEIAGITEYVKQAS